MNFYIEFHQQKIAAANTHKQLEFEKDRSNRRAAGMCLNRGFNESPEQFFERRPEFKEFIEWNKNIAQKASLQNVH